MWACDWNCVWSCGVNSNQNIRLHLILHNTIGLIMHSTAQHSIHSDTIQFNALKCLQLPQSESDTKQMTYMCRKLSCNVVIELNRWQPPAFGNEYAQCYTVCLAFAMSASFLTYDVACCIGGWPEGSCISRRWVSYWHFCSQSRDVLIEGCVIPNLEFGLFWKPSAKLVVRVHSGRSG